MSAEFKKYKILGYTTDFNQCDCCGRENLKGTISMLDLNNEVVLHFGTGCAYSTDKYDSIDAAKMAKREVNNCLREHKNKIHSARIFAWKYIRSVYGKVDGTTLDKKIWEPLVNSFESFYTNPENKFKTHPLLKSIKQPK